VKDDMDGYYPTEFNYGGGGGGVGGGDDRFDGKRTAAVPET
jgi:hypothetical protein